MNNDRADGHAIHVALLGFNDLGRSVTPYFSFQKQILFTIIISTLSKNEQIYLRINVAKFKISVHGTWNPAILCLQGA